MGYAFTSDRAPKSQTFSTEGKRRAFFDPAKVGMTNILECVVSNGMTVVTTGNVEMSIDPTSLGAFTTIRQTSGHGTGLRAGIGRAGEKSSLRIEVRAWMLQRGRAGNDQSVPLTLSASFWSRARTLALLWCSR